MRLLLIYVDKDIFIVPCFNIACIKLFKNIGHPKLDIDIAARRRGGTRQFRNCVCLGGHITTRTKHVKRYFTAPLLHSLGFDLPSFPV